MSGFLSLAPEQASAYGGAVDTLFIAFAALVVLLSAPVFILMLVFAVKYRRGRTVDRTHARNRNVWLEVSWALLPFLLILGFFVWATKLFFDEQRPPPGALQIAVVAKQWMWKFQHPGGQAEIDELHVPTGEPVTLTMASQDVIHSLYVPALRIKQDVLPGRYTRLWFTVDAAGTYPLDCAEFCGTDHSAMTGRLIAMAPADYATWLEDAGTDRSLAAEGEALFRSSGCSGCHGPSSTVHAPRLEGLFGSPVPLASGEVVTADDQYVRDSILLPQAQVAAGYPAIMPTYANLLGEDEVMALVAYIRSLGGPP